MSISQLLKVDVACVKVSCYVILLPNFKIFQLPIDALTDNNTLT